MADAKVEFSNLLGLEGPVTKLIEVCANGLGAVFGPWLIKRNAEALAAAQKLLEAGDLKIEGAELGSIQEQVKARVTYQEAKRQRNLAQVVAASRSALPTGEVSPEPVDPDWTARFFTTVQDVSNEDMQKLWGKLLAGEVVQPGSFSLRTLELVRNLSSREAQLFSEACDLTLVDPFGTAFLIDPSPTITGSLQPNPLHRELDPAAENLMGLYEARGLSREALRLLAEIGLLAPVLGDGRNYEPGPKATEFYLELRAGTGTLVLKEPNPKVFLTIPCIRLSAIGKELRNVHVPSPVPDFEEFLVRSTKRIGL